MRIKVKQTVVKPRGEWSLNFRILMGSSSLDSYKETGGILHPGSYVINLTRLVSLYTPSRPEQAACLDSTISSIPGDIFCKFWHSCTRYEGVRNTTGTSLFSWVECWERLRTS